MITVMPTCHFGVFDLAEIAEYAVFAPLSDLAHQLRVGNACFSLLSIILDSGDRVMAKNRKVTSIAWKLAAFIPEGGE